MIIRIRRLPGTEDIPLPAYATEYSAGMDLRAARDAMLKAGIPVIVPTGLVVQIAPGYEGQIRSRSGLSLLGVTVANAPGTIDSDYRGEVGVILVYRPDPSREQSYRVFRGDRIAQLVIGLCGHAELAEVGGSCPKASQPGHRVQFPTCHICGNTGLVLDIDITRRGDGGFGSTGDK